MQTSRLRLIVCCIATASALAAAYWSNSVLLMGISDSRAADCTKMSAAILIGTLIVALRRFGQGRSSSWYLVLCTGWLCVVAAMLVFGACVPLSVFPTPQLLIYGLPIAATVAGAADRIA